MAEASDLMQMILQVGFKPKEVRSCDMNFELIRVYHRKRKKTEQMTAFEQVSRIEKRLRADLTTVSDLLFKLHNSSDSVKSIQLTNGIMSKISSAICTLKLIKSHIKRA